MRRAALLFGAVFLFAGEAGAQTTSCGWVFGRMVCDAEQEQPSLPSPGIMLPSEQGATAQSNAAAAANLKAALTGAMEEPSQADLRKTVGRIAAEGRCEDAKNAALIEGDFDLAERALALCTPAAREQPFR